METQETRTNSIGTRDWLKATEHMAIGANVVGRNIAHEREAQTHTLKFGDSIEPTADTPVESTKVVS